MQVERDFTMLQARADADSDMTHVAARDHTRLQLLLEAEQKNFQSVESTVTNLSTRVSDRLTLVDGG